MSKVLKQAIRVRLKKQAALMRAGKWIGHKLKGAFWRAKDPISKSEYLQLVKRHGTEYGASVMRQGGKHFQIKRGLFDIPAQLLGKRRGEFIREGVRSTFAPPVFAPGTSKVRKALGYTSKYGLMAGIPGVLAYSGLKEANTPGEKAKAIGGAIAGTLGGSILAPKHGLLAGIAAWEAAQRGAESLIGRVTKGVDARHRINQVRRYLARNPEVVQQLHSKGYTVPRKYMSQKGKV